MSRGRFLHRIALSDGTSYGAASSPDFTRPAKRARQVLDYDGDWACFPFLFTSQGPVVRDRRSPKFEYLHFACSLSIFTLFVFYKRQI